MKQFFKVISSIVEANQNQHINIQTGKLILFINFIQKLSLLFPLDGYGTNLYQDVYIIILYRIVAPFTSVELFTTWRLGDTLYVWLAFINFLNFLILLALILLTALFKFEKFNPLKPKGIFKILSQFIFLYLTYTEQLIYIPVIYLNLHIFKCGSQSLSVLSSNIDCNIFLMCFLALPGILFQSAILYLQQYFYRTYQLWPQNVLKKKFSLYALLNSLTLIIHMELNTNDPKMLIIYLRLLLANSHAFFGLYEYFTIYPYIPPINDFGFQLQSVYFCICLTMSLCLLQEYSIISLHLLPLVLLIFSTFTYYIIGQVNDRQSLSIIRSSRLGQNKILYKAQLLYSLSQMKIEVFRKKILEFLPKQRKLDLMVLLCIVSSGNLFQYRMHSDGQSNVISRQIIDCLLLSAVKSHNSRGQSLEVVQLFYISYELNEKLNPLSAFCLLKNYQIKSEKISFYLGSTIGTWNDLLQEQILLKQSSLETSSLNEYHEKEIQAKDIQNCDKIIQTFVPRFIEIIGKKIDFWMNLMRGYNHISDFAEQTSQLSEFVRQVKIDFEKALNIDLTDTYILGKVNNVLILRVISAFFSCVINDYEFSYLCENQIEEILRIERSFNIDLVLNSTVINEQVILVQVSIIQNRGQLVFKNKRTVQDFFGYRQSKDFQNISNLNQLIPEFFISEHEKLINNFIKIGYCENMSTAQLNFALNSQGQIFPIHKKIQNFFETQDDYVLTAQLQRVQANNDYLLFDQKGHLIGLTDNLYGLFSKGIINFHLFKMAQLSICFFVPNMIQLLQKQQQQLKEKNNDLIMVEDKTIMTIPGDLSKVVDIYQQLLRDRTSKFNTSPQRTMKSVSHPQNETNDQQINQEQMHQESNIDLLSLDQKIMIESFQQCLAEQRIKTTEYLIRFLIGFQMMGEDQLPYFYLELTDIRPKQIDYTQVKVDVEDILQTQRTNLSHLVDVSVLSAMQIESDQIKLVKGSDNVNFLKKPIKPVYEQDDQFPLSARNQYENQDIDSARLSHVVGPLSQRVQFIVPQNQNVQNIVNMDDLEDIEKDFKNIQDFYNDQSLSQSQEVLRNLSSSRIPQLAQIRESDEELQINEKEIHNSSKKDYPSHQIQRILSKHKIDHLVDQDQENNNNQSQSSRSSLTAKRETLTLIKGLRSRTRFTQNLRQLQIIYILLITSVTICVAVNCQIISNNHTTLSSKVDDVLTPQIFSEQYFLVIAYGWLYTLDQLGILNLSNYIQTQIQVTSRYIHDSYASTLGNMFAIFSGIDQQGLIGRVNIKFIQDQEIPNQGFSTFFFTAQEKIAKVLEMNYLTGDINSQFINNLLFLKENLSELIRVNTNLVSTISEIFTQQLQDQNDQYTIIFIAELMVTTLIMIIPIIYWKRLAVSQQRILMFISRVHEKAAQQMIVRLVTIREILLQSCDVKWKQMNYFDLMYERLDEQELKKLNIDFKQYRAVLTTEKDNRGPNKRGNLSRNQILTSKIKQLSFSIRYELIFSLLIYLFVCLYYIGGQNILMNQEQSTQPSQKLIVQLVKFNLHYETMVITGTLAKSYYLLYPQLMSSNYFQIEHELSMENLQLQSSDSLLKFFITSFEYDEREFQSLWNNILVDKNLSPQDSEIMRSIQEDSLCQQSYDILPFCQLQDLGIKEFRRLYGTPKSGDNNLHYMSKGLTGVIQAGFQKIRQSFSYEFTYKKYMTDQTQLLEYIRSTEFVNVFIEHFLDYYQVIQLYQSITVESTRKKMSDNLSISLDYYLSAGILVILILMLTFVIWLSKRNYLLQLLRLGITNVPMEVLFDPQMMLLLKKIDRE